MLFLTTIKFDYKIDIYKTLKEIDLSHEHNNINNLNPSYRERKIIFYKNNRDFF